MTGSLPQAWTVKRIAYAGAPMTPTLAEELTGALHPELTEGRYHPLAEVRT